MASKFSFNAVQFVLSCHDNRCGPCHHVRVDVADRFIRTGTENEIPGVVLRSLVVRNFLRAGCWLLVPVLLIASSVAMATDCGPEAPCEIDGGSYYLRVPDGAGPHPVLIWFHGWSGTFRRACHTRLAPGKRLGIAGTGTQGQSVPVKPR